MGILVRILLVILDGDFGYQGDFGNEFCRRCRDIEVSLVWSLVDSLMENLVGILVGSLVGSLGRMAAHASYTVVEGVSRGV